MLLSLIILKNHSAAEQSNENRFTCQLEKEKRILQFVSFKATE